MSANSVSAQTCVRVNKGPRLLWSVLRNALVSLLQLLSSCFRPDVVECSVDNGFTLSRQRSSSQSWGSPDVDECQMTETEQCRCGETPQMSKRVLRMFQKHDVLRHEYEQEDLTRCRASYTSTSRETLDSLRYLASELEHVRMSEQYD